MTNIKITELPSATSIKADDLLVMVDSGNPYVTKKITWENLSNSLSQTPIAATTISGIDLHNGGVQNAEIFQFSDVSYQSVITGPTPALGNSSQRIIVQGQRSQGGEGGDVYLWGGDSDSNGGDIKIYAGDADNVAPNNGYGGYVNIDGGKGSSVGGSIEITAGYSEGGQAGNINIAGGSTSTGVNGSVVIKTNNNSNNWVFDKDGSLTLPSGSTLSETNNTVSLAPPTAASGQSLVIRPTVALWLLNSSNYIEYGNPITISVTLQSWAYFGTVNYTISGNGVTQQSLGRSLTGKLTFISTDAPDVETITWTIPANSEITEFTLTLISVDGTRSTDPATQNDPTLYYNFEESNGMPIGQFITVTNNGISSSEHSHVHLVAGDPSTVDIYLGDDDQYVKIEKDGGDVIIGTNSNTNHWIFGNDGNLSINGESIITEAPQDGTTYGRKDGDWMDITSPANLQIRRGTTEEIAAITPLEGEPIYDTSEKLIRIGDGETIGGIIIGNQTRVAGGPNDTFLPLVEDGYTGETVSIGPSGSIWKISGYKIFTADYFTVTAPIVKTGGDIDNTSILAGYYTVINPDESVMGGPVTFTAASVTPPTSSGSEADIWVIYVDLIIRVEDNSVVFSFDAASTGGDISTSNDLIIAQRLS